MRNTVPGSSVIPGSLEHYLIDAAAHALRAVFVGADPHWIAACARLQVLGAERAGIDGKEEDSCLAMLAAFETQLAGKRIPFLPSAQQIVIGDVIHTEPVTINVG